MKKDPKKHIIPSLIQILSINIFKANFETTEAFLAAPKKPARLNFELANNLASNVEEKKLRIRLTFNLKGLNEMGDDLGLTLEYGIEFHFLIQNLDSFIKYRDDQLQEVQEAMAATTLGMAYSTARGMVFERTRGTYFESVILPIIDPFEAIKDKSKQVA